MVMAAISLVNVRNRILKDITLEIREGEIFALVGPSGAGKTTLLHVLAGLLPYQGQVYSGDRSLDEAPPYKRQVGYLFQDLLLFPHLTVEENLTLAMGRQLRGKRRKRKRAVELLELVGIAALARRFPDELSGGEKQRAALARALASSPRILLLDEPFSSLDFRVARYLRMEFKRLQQRLRLNVLFVTHNLEEAQELADRIGVLKQGRLVQVVSPNDLWTQAGTDRNSFLVHPNILYTSDHKALENGLIEVEWAGYRFVVPDEGKAFERVAIHPRDVYISALPAPGPPINRFQGRVGEIAEMGGIARILLEVADRHIYAEVNVEYLKTLNLSIGDQVYAILKLRALHGC